MSVRLGLLALLAQAPRHGYQLRGDLEAATGHLWSLNVGQVYTTLDRLERDRLVSRDDEPDPGATDERQRRYVITAAGLDEVKAWWEATGADAAPPRDELSVKVLVAVATGDAALLRTVLDAQRAGLVAALQRHRRQARGADPASVLAADLVVVRLEADLRWLDLCEARTTTTQNRKGARS